METGALSITLGNNLLTVIEENAFRPIMPYITVLDLYGNYNDSVTFILNNIPLKFIIFQSSVIIAVFSKYLVFICLLFIDNLRKVTQIFTL